VEKAISQTCKTHNARIRDYTVAPILLDGKHRGAHEWFVEFSIAPKDKEQFKLDLDQALQNLNSDYAAKRTGNIALEPLHLVIAPDGTFHQWMAYRGKLGGQNKVPRLSNDRRYIDELLLFMSSSPSLHE
jgi:hypothetical protein